MISINSIPPTHQLGMENTVDPDQILPSEDN